MEAWGEIAQKYNSSTTEPRTWEQLRCKYDNLKKEVRKYYAKLKQNLLKTGGGKPDISIKKSTECLYNKIYEMISMTVDGLPPSSGDSDEVGQIRNIPIVLAESKEQCGSAEIHSSFDSGIHDNYLIISLIKHSTTHTFETNLIFFLFYSQLR